MRKKGVHGNSLLSVQFFCKPKTALRNSLLIPKRNTQPSMLARPGSRRKCIADGTTGAPGSPENSLSMLNPTRKGSDAEV